MADSDSSLTPEQRLLKLIEEQESKDSSASVRSPAAASVDKKKTVRSVDWKSLFTPAGIKERFFSLQSGLSQGFSGQRGRIQLRDVNRGMKLAAGLLALIMAGVVAYDFTVMSRDYQAELKMTSAHGLDIVSAPEEDAPVSPFDPLNVRNVFAPIQSKVDKAQEVSSSTLRLIQMTGNFKLTGISDNPENPSRTFCMIEDLEKNITFFLKTGDTISGMVVEKIKADSVILRHLDETIEIR